MKKVYFLTILTVLLVFAAAETAHAVSNAAVLYLRVAAGARPGGMGEAFVSIADDATATYWNPAGLGNSPIAGKMETLRIPDEYGDISDVVTLKRSGKLEHWLIADGKLIMFNGRSWSSGTKYTTSSDQSLEDFVNSITTYESAEQVESVSLKIVESNCNVTLDEIEYFIKSVRENIPADYPETEALNKSLDSLAASYRLCLVSTQQFRSLRSKLNNGLKDETLSAGELDKITFSIESALMRFLPSRLIVPYTASINGNILCLGKSGDYVWIGTDNGAYRLSGRLWARFTENDGLPSNEILSIDNFDETLLLGTSKGLVSYFHGSFTIVAEVPAEPVSAVSIQSFTTGSAVIGGKVYRNDGVEWSSSYAYTVRLDDTIEDIARLSAIYKTPSEIEYLINEIKRLNTPEATSVELADAESDSVIVADNTGEELTEAVEEDSEAVEVTNDSSIAESVEIAPLVSDNGWFVEGAIIQIPYSAPLKYDANATIVDKFGRIWVGTTSGLVAFDGFSWQNHGYDVFTVPEASGDEDTTIWTATKIAQNYLNDSDEEKVAILAENINDYNELNNQPLTPGQKVYVYNWNTGSEIYTIGMLLGEIYVGTEYGLEHYNGSTWNSVDFQKLDHRTVVGVYEFEGASYYIGSDGLTLETKGTKEFVLMHVNWLPSLDLDIYYDFGSYVHNIRGLGTLGISVIYLNYGTIVRTDASGNPDGEINPFEFAIAASFGTSITSRLKGGLTGRFIHSRLSPQGAGAEQGEGIASTISFDFGILYKVTRRIQFGAAVTNLGPDITYIDADQADALPRNLGVGISYKVWDTPYNSLVIQGELNKMLVNLNKGYTTELEYAIRHIGMEYWYANFIALRAGYKYDKEGSVKHLTFGTGLKLLNTFRFDFAYVPSSIDSPLANTLRMSVTGMFN
ncbi:MAG: PorV/PorQ family protein [candidate division Zixibacteria bacterium]|nr:PorV/PorQ family protein [candidate division Zixibacteria bacterium]